MSELNAQKTADRADTIWQRSSVTVDYHASRSGIPFADAHFEIMHRLLNAAGLPVRTLLDLGAGDGIVTEVVARRQALERSVLVDFSEPMLDAARQRFDGQPQTFDVSYVAGDFRETDWHGDVAQPGPFDAVVSRFAIHHIPDDLKRNLYQAIFGWLRPGGMFVNIEHVASASPLYADAHDQMMIDGIMASRETGDAESVATAYRNRQDSGANILAPVQDQVEWLRNIGFVDVDIAFKAFELSVFAGRRPA